MNSIMEIFKDNVFCLTTAACLQGLTSSTLGPICYIDTNNHPITKFTRPIKPSIIKELKDDDIIIHDGFKITSPLRTLADIIDLLGYSDESIEIISDIFEIYPINDVIEYIKSKGLLHKFNHIVDKLGVTSLDELGGFVYRY